MTRPTITRIPPAPSVTPLHPMHRPGTWGDAILSAACVAITGGALVVVAAIFGG